MNPMLALAVMSLSSGAPVPKETPPNPLGWSYMGVRLNNVDQGPLQINPPDPGTPAYKAGLQGGDVLVKVGKIQPQSFNEVIKYIFELRPGTVIAIQVRRGTENVTLMMRLEERPNSAEYRLPDFILQAHPQIVPRDPDE